MALPNTHFGVEYISSLMEGKKHVFFDGIGGVSMCSLAEITRRAGHEVSGYDRSPSPITQALEDMGIKIYYDAKAENMAGADILVYTLAMPGDDPEYLWAGEHNIPRISRADYLGYIMSGYTHRFGIAGTHGKSTTTGMVARILGAAGVHPTVFNGALMKESSSYNIIGEREFFAFEACEYMDSFLDFFPTTAIVLNVELDHVDYFPSLERIKESFARFLDLTGEDGVAVVNFDDENAMDTAREYKGRLVTFGLSEGADYGAAEVHFVHGYPEFTLTHREKPLADIRLRVPGQHSVSDALAAAAACHEAGIPVSAIAEGLNSYEGIARRMEYITETAAGAAVFTDYAHHPTEIGTTLSGACALGYHKVRVIFQPHTFSRTHELFTDFADAFANSGIGELILCDIYPARETNVYGVSSEQLCTAIQSRGLPCRVIATPEAAAQYAAETSGKGDMLLVMGAGDVIKAVEVLKG